MSTTPAESQPPALLDDPAVTAAVEAHDHAEVAVTEAKHRLAQAREAVRDTLFAAATRYRDRRRPLPRADLYRLYWDHRELRTTDLANAFGIATSELARLAGPTEGHEECAECDQLVSTLIVTRSPRTGDARTRFRCTPCRERQEARQERDRQREHELDLARIAAGEPLLSGRSTIRDLRGEAGLDW